MTRTVQAALALIGALLALIFCAPLRWFLPEQLVSARAVTGSIWSGRIEDVAVGPLRLGTLSTRLRWPGRLEVQVEPGGADALRLTLSPGTRLSVSGADGRVPLGMTSGPITAEALTLRGAALELGEEGCMAAKGRVLASARLTQAAILPPLALSGTLVCVGRDLSTVMKSQSGLEQIDFRLFPGARWQARILIRPTSPDLADMLRSNGFSESPLGYVRVEQGGLGG